MFTRWSRRSARRETRGTNWAFAVGPFCFDMSDEETRQFIRDAFAVARENDVAVAFHIDDSMCWGERKDLLSNPDNIETADWKQIPNTGRRADWGPKPTKFPPQMCFNSPAIVAAVKKRAALIGAEVKKELDVLKTAGQGAPVCRRHRRMGDADRPRFRNRPSPGLSRPQPSRLQREAIRPRTQTSNGSSVVKEFIELWANSLHAAGIPREKIFCHIAFTDQGLRKADAKESYAEKVTFALPEVAFSSAYRPGFSTYPEGSDLQGSLCRSGATRFSRLDFRRGHQRVPHRACPASPPWKPIWGGCSTTGR